MLYPLTFKPVFKERIWGGRNLETLYRKQLPANLPIGESWEITDRPEGVGVISQGSLAGKDLRWLLERYHEEVMGPVPLLNGRFPLLAKILDAEEKLSLQVHPPASAAAVLNGEPKTEMWYVGHARPGAELYVGLKRGVTRDAFAERLAVGGVADCFHRIPVQTGAAMFVPSGRVHGIGAGCVIFEIQQSSDTTYRVFDWNRVGPDGQARDLHIPQSLDSIDFNDPEPALISNACEGPVGEQVRRLVSCPFFDVELRRLTPGKRAEFNSHLVILAVVDGSIQVEHNSCRFALGAGSFCLLPASLERTICHADAPADLLVTFPK